MLYEDDEDDDENRNKSLVKLKEFFLDGNIINRLNYSEILDKLNITEDDIDYLNNYNVKNTKEICYCNSIFFNLAQSYKYYHGYIAIIVCFFGIIANILNIVILTRKDMVLIPINRILTGLAIADMLVMIEYLPFTIYKYFVFPERKTFAYGWALFILIHMHFAQLSHTISTALTITLAVWRYIAIRFPQLNHSLCTISRCNLALWCSSLAPIIVCAPSYLVFRIHEQIVEENAKIEIIYHVDANYSNQAILYKLNFWVLGVIMKFLPCIILTIISFWLIKFLYQAKSRKQALRMYNVKIIGKKEGFSKSERRADRTTKMLVAVLLLFLITEIPHGILGLLSGILGECFFRNCYQKFGELMDIFALLNGAINFILYCSMSRQFRTSFRQIFKPNIIKKWQPQTCQSTYV